MKKCNRCKTEKELSEFGKLKSSKDGLQYWCKNCINENNSKAQKQFKKEQRELGKCVYLHKNPTTGEVFYVGIGRECRANNFRGRNKFWNNYVKKYGVDVEIIYKGLGVREANELEIELIRKYGRRDKNKGTLVNLSDGGEGIKTNANYEDTHKCYCLKTQKIYSSINQFCIENELSYTAVVQFLKSIKNNKTKAISKDYNVRQLRKDNSVIWHSTERFVRSDFENIDDFKDLEYKEDLNFKRLSDIHNDAVNSFFSLENSLYKKEHNFNIFKNIDRGMSYHEASEVLGLSYHQVYGGYNNTKDYLKNYILYRY